MRIRSTTLCVQSTMVCPSANAAIPWCEYVLLSGGMVARQKSLLFFLTRMFLLRCYALGQKLVRICRRLSVGLWACFADFGIGWIRWVNVSPTFGRVASLDISMQLIFAPPRRRNIGIWSIL